MRTIDSWFGSRNQMLRERLLKELDGMLPDPDEELPQDEIHVKTESDKEEDAWFRAEIREERLKQGEDARSRINSIIDHGLVKGEENETAGDVTAAYALALHAAAKPQPWDHGMEADLWSGFAIGELYDQLQPLFDDTTNTYLSYFIGGNSLFGDGFEDVAGWYLFLSNADIHKFKTGISKTCEEVRALVDMGALSDIDFESHLISEMECIIETLTVLDSNGHDLFMLADG